MDSTQDANRPNLQDVPRRKEIESLLASYNESLKLRREKQHLAASRHMGSIREGIRQKHILGDATWQAVLHLDQDPVYQRARLSVELVDHLRRNLSEKDFSFLDRIYINPPYGIRQFRFLGYLLERSTRGLRYRRATILLRAWDIAEHLLTEEKLSLTRGEGPTPIPMKGPYRRIKS